MAVAYKPFFSTSYGDSFGYNEREGFNPRTFRNRHLDPLYEGAKTSTAYNRFAETVPLAATAPAATIQANNRFNNPPVAAPSSQYHYQPHPPRSQKPSVYSAGAGGYSAASAAYSRSAPISAAIVTDQSAPYTRYSNSLGFDPISAPAHQSLQPLPTGDWSYSNTSSSALVTLPAGVYDIKPTLAWDGKASRPSAIGPGGPLPHPHPLLPSYDTDGYGKRDPMQQIPFGRLSSLKPHQVYEKELKEDQAREAQQFAQFPEATHSANYHRPGLEAHKIESAQNYGKLSISRRLPEGARLRYHLPGYCGFVRSLQFRHGDTFGRSTRKSLLDLPENL